MMNTFSNSLKLVKGSLKLVWENPILFLFPILGILALVVTVVLLAMFTVGSSSILLTMTGDQTQAFASTTIFFVLILFVFIAPFSGTFFAVALSYETGEVLKGKKPSLSRGIQHALKNLKEIALWALTLIAINILQSILRQIAQRYGGRHVPLITDGVISILMAGWGFATAFVIPIMAFEDTNPFDSIKKSVKLLKHTWGETLVGGIGAGTVLGLLIIPLFLILFIPFVGIFFIPLFILGVIFIGLLTQVFNTVFMTVLYLYATEKDTKKAEHYFDKDLILHSFY